MGARTASFTGARAPRSRAARHSSERLLFGDSVRLLRCEVSGWDRSDRASVGPLFKRDYTCKARTEHSGQGLTQGMFMSTPNSSTFHPKAADIHNDWLEVDATDMTLGRLATEVASRLRGKHKPTFAPNVDTGDHIIIVNADKVYLNGKKASEKLYQRYSGFPGGLKSRTYTELLANKPDELIRITVRGMLPKNSLGRQMLLKLKVYSGPTHPHEAQKPVKLDLPQARRAV